MPQLQDPNFRRSVVLLVHHDDSGTFGLVLNRTASVLASNLCESLGIHWQGETASEIHWGGPVQPNTGWALFDESIANRSEEGDSSRVTDGLFFAGSLDVLRQIARSPASDSRLFLGYAGWGPGQLEMEMSEGAWLVAPASAELVFSVDPEELWEHVLRRLGVDPATLIATRGVH